MIIETDDVDWFSETLDCSSICIFTRLTFGNLSLGFVLWHPITHIGQLLKTKVSRFLYLFVPQDHPEYPTGKGELPDPNPMTDGWERDHQPYSIGRHLDSYGLTDIYH